MKNKKLNEPIIFFSFYLLNIFLIRFLFFTSPNFNEIHICSIFIGLLVSFYFMFNFKRKVIFLTFPLYYLICCMLCVVFVQAWSLNFQKPSENFYSILKSLIHNIIAILIFTLPFVIVSTFEKFVLLKIISKFFKYK